MTTNNELAPLFKRLKLGAILNTLPERLALARREKLDYVVPDHGPPSTRSS